MNKQRKALEEVLSDAYDPHLNGLQKTTIAMVEEALAEPEQDPVSVDDLNRTITSQQNTLEKYRSEIARWQAMYSSAIRQLTAIHNLLPVPPPVTTQDGKTYELYLDQETANACLKELAKNIQSIPTLFKEQSFNQPSDRKEINKDDLLVQNPFTLEYEIIRASDLNKEKAIRDKLIAMGWTPPV